MRYFIFLISAFVILSCGKKAEQAPVDDPKKESEALVAQATAEKLIFRFVGELKRELSKGMSSGGAGEAIRVCSEKAPELAAGFSREGLVSIRRVTDRPRNANNVVDEYMAKYLSTFIQAPSGSDLTYGEWSNRNGESWYCYYKAIKTELFCMRCHGASDGLADGVSEALAVEYPDDKAVGYAPGDVRGMFVVEMKWPESKTFIDSVTTAN